MLPDLPPSSNSIYYKLNLRSLINSAKGATPEFRSESSSTQIILPHPDGSFNSYKIYETNLMEPALAKKYSEIKVYSLKSDKDDATGKLVVGPHGMSAYVASLENNEQFVIRPISKIDPTQYVVFYSKDDPVNDNEWTCQWDAENAKQHHQNSEASKIIAPNDTGNELRVFRLTITIPGTLSEANGWSTKAQVMTGVVSFLAQINTVYERDVAIRFVLPDNADELFFLDDDTDPFTTDGGGSITEENVIVTNDVIGFENYDVGMILVTGGCCAASLPSVCTSSKAFNFSRYNNVQVTCHELGHQFNGHHTWSYCGNDGATFSSEYGSGTTVMSYTGICGDNDILPAQDITYFGVFSQIQMTNYVNSISCYQTIPTGNSIPAVTVPSSGGYIPISTPYVLVGSATDMDNDFLTYSWEQNDIDGTDFTVGLPVNTTPTAADGNVPIQRLFNPVSTSNRYIPQISDVLTNTNSIYERLPTYTRSINYRLYVRDNAPGSGGTTHDLYQLNVDGTAGPFLVTSPNTCVTYTAGSSQTITWDVVNTTNTNVNCQNVNILLSVDGGVTWEYTLSSNTANDGTESITLPSGICTNEARIKLEANDNIFYDVSDADFIIDDSSGGLVKVMAATLDGDDDQISIDNTLGNFGTNNFTFEAWIKTSSTENDIIAGKRESCGCANFWQFMIFDNKLRLEISEAGCANYFNYSGSTVVNDGTWKHVAFVRNGNSVQLYVDGVLDASLSPVPQDVSNTTDFEIGTGPCNRFFEGEIDDVRVWNAARSATDIVNNMGCELVGTETDLEAYITFDKSTCTGCSSGSLVVTDKTANGHNGILESGAGLILSSVDIEECPTCTNGNITITTQPTSQSGSEGNMVTFTVVATGTNISYQWYVSTDGGSTFEPLGGSESSTLELTLEEIMNNNKYKCLLVNGCDVQETTVADLTVTCGTLTISDIIGDSAPCSENYYSYYVSPNADVENWAWSVPSGWTFTNFGSSILALPNTTSGTVSVTATDACGVMLVKNFAVAPVDIQITSQPSNQTINEGDPSAFTISVTSGGGTNVYQWQQSQDMGLSWSDVSGATSSTYNVASTPLSLDDRLYRCLVTNSCLQDTSNQALLVVNCVSSAPDQADEIEGGSIICGTATLTYRIDEIPGATSYIWTIPGGWTGFSTTNEITVTTNGSGGNVSVVATNTCGSSATLVLAVVANLSDCQRSVHFDGIDDYLSVAQNGQYLNGDLTISFWMKPEILSGSQQIIFNGTEFRVFLEDDHFEFTHSVYGNGYNGQMQVNFESAAASLTSNIWVYVAITRNVTTREARLYLNGSFVESQVWSSDLPSVPDDNTDYDMIIGAGVNGDYLKYKGNLDEIKIWSVLKSDTEVSEDMFCVPSGSETNLMAYYGFEQGQPNGDNTSISSLTNSASAYPSASLNNLAKNGTTSNIIDGTKTISISGLDEFCPADSPLTYEIDLPGTPTVTWTLPSGWAGSSTTESITLTPNSTGGLLIAEASLSCGTVRLEKIVGPSTAPLVSSIVNSQALDFDGTDDILEVPSGSSIDLNGKSFTVEFWAKRNSQGTSSRYIVSQGTAGTNTFLHIGFLSGNQFRFAFYANDLDASSSYSDELWHHWACVYDKDISAPNHNRFIYRDGEVVASDRTDNDFVGNGNVNIGRFNGGNYFHGRLDELRVWDGAKSMTEIQTGMFCPPTCISSDILLYLPMEDGVANASNIGLLNISEYSIYNNSVSLSNFALTGTSSNIVTGNAGPYYTDGDNDGFGDLNSVVSDFCNTPYFVKNSHDCDDTDSAINPYAEEICGNTVDDNCDGDTDFVVNKALDFDGGNHEVNIPVLAHSEFFTVEAWIKIDVADSGWNPIITWGGSSPSATFGISGASLIAYFEDGGFHGGNAMNDGIWHHVALIHNGYTGNNIKVYVDGVLRLDSNLGNTISNTNTIIGDGFRGQIDDVRFWDAVLAEDQIRDRMNLRLDGTESNLIRYYPFDYGQSGSDNTDIDSAIDKTVNNLNGDLAGFSLTGSTSNWVNGRTYPTIYPDSDNDMFGGTTAWSCGSMTGFLENNQDCDDSDDSINPFAEEVCGNGIDDNCDGDTDFVVNKALDFDGSGHEVELPVVPHTEVFSVEAWIKGRSGRSGLESHHHMGWFITKCHIRHIRIQPYCLFRRRRFSWGRPYE